MADQDIPFERIGGYRVVRRLATGGTSDVLLARAEGPHGFERTVVLKLLLRQFQRDAPMEKMFAREAAAYARLSHPAIVKLYDFFSAEGQLVMVLEYVDGLPLNRFRAMLRKSGDALDDRASIFIASRIFAALAAAHGARDPETGEFSPMIHRDVNPSNVLLPWDGHVKLADFGIAKVAGVPTDTKSGFIKGTYGYMAPEQVRGEPVTVRTDVYAASLLLWELLARRKAIQRGALPEMEVLRAMAEPSLPSLDVLRPDLPARLREAVARGLASQPDQRNLTAEEMLAVLRDSVTSNEGRNVLVDVLSRVRPETSDLASTASRSIADLRPRISEPPPAPPFKSEPPPPPRPSVSPKAPDTRALPSRTMVMGITPSPIIAVVAAPAQNLTPPPPPPSTPPPAPPAPMSPVAAALAATLAAPGPPSTTATTDVSVPGFFAAALVGPGGNGPPAHAPVRVPISTFPPPTNGGPGAPLAPLYGAPPPGAAPSVPPEPHEGSHAGAAPLEPFVDPDATTRSRSSSGKGALYALVAGGGLLAVALLVAGVLFLTRSSGPPPTPHAIVGGLRPEATRVAPPSAATLDVATTTTTTSPKTSASPSPSAPPSAPVAVASVATVPSAATLIPVATAAPPPAAVPVGTDTAGGSSSTGRILTPPSAGGHRIFVDGKYAGDTPTPVSIRCGSHTVKIGSHGAAQTVDVPCGGDVTVDAR